ncbi:MAG: 4'-phosphopantetheinyl transferase superfamily protein [Acidobacteriota bacterium]
MRVWHADTRVIFADASVRSRALTWLSGPEQDRYGRYRMDIDREMFLLGRVMARALVGQALGVDPMTWPWREGPRGRPEIADETTPMHFNVAHSAGVVVCAVAAARVVGVDVEDRVRRQVDANVVRRYCSPREIADIERQGEAGWHDQFLKYWTLKEAYLKARGLGIAVHLAHVSFAIAPGAPRVEFLDSLAGTDANWAFELSELGERHVLAVAAPLRAGIRPTFSVAPMPVDVLP